MQIAQLAQEGMESGFQRRTRIAAPAGRRVAALKIGAGAERAARAGQDHAAHLVALLVDGVERFAETAEHVHRNRVHDLLMVQLEDPDRAVDLERAVLELHRFLVFVWRLTRVFAPYLIFGTPLSMLASVNPNGNAS